MANAYAISYKCYVEMIHPEGRKGRGVMLFGTWDSGTLRADREIKMTLPCSSILQMYASKVLRSGKASSYSKASASDAPFCAYSGSAATVYAGDIRQKGDWIALGLE